MLGGCVVAMSRMLENVCQGAEQFPSMFIRPAPTRIMGCLRGFLLRMPYRLSSAFFFFPHFPVYFSFVLFFSSSSLLFKFSFFFLSIFSIFPSIVFLLC